MNLDHKLSYKLNRLTLYQ